MESTAVVSMLVLTEACQQSEAVRFRHCMRRFNAGKDNNGRPVYVVHNKKFWQKQEPDFWNNMWLYILKEFASVPEPFTVVYVHDSR